MTRLDDVVTDIADLLCPPRARPRRGRARDAPTGTAALSPRRRPRGALCRIDRSHGARPRSHAPHLRHRSAAAACRPFASSSSQRSSGPWPNSTLRSRSPAAAGDRAAREPNTWRSSAASTASSFTPAAFTRSAAGRFWHPIGNRRNEMPPGALCGESRNTATPRICRDFLRGPRRASNPRPSAYPSVPRSTSQETRKSSICRYFQAAEGTRTLDLLHGKQSTLTSPIRFLPANERFQACGASEGVAVFRPVLPGLCQPIVNRQSYTRLPRFRLPWALKERSSGRRSGAEALASSES
jgi:hypothetical protein